MRGPGGGTGGSGQPGPACKSPLCGVGGSAPSRKPKAVWVDGMGGPGTGGGEVALLDSGRKRITFGRRCNLLSSDYASDKQTYL